jgi:hypothetical protein
MSVDRTGLLLTKQDEGHFARYGNRNLELQAPTEEVELHGELILSQSMDTIRWMFHLVDLPTQRIRDAYEVLEAP